MNSIWSNLTREEADELYGLMSASKPWLSWASMGKQKRRDTPEPRRPTDDEFMRTELLSMKMWGMPTA